MQKTPAYGMSADKQSTEGVLSFTPLPAVGATSLTIRMELLAGGDTPESITFTVTLSPLQVHRNDAGFMSSQKL